MNEKYLLLLDTLKSKAGTLNPFVIAESLGVEIRYVPFLSNPEGQYMKILDDRVILLNDKYKDNNKRYFLLAHELHHAIEHEELSGYYVQSDITRGKLENEANTFAYTLLFNFFIEDNGTVPPAINDLILAYGIPKRIIEDYI